MKTEKIRLKKCIYKLATLSLALVPMVGFCGNSTGSITVVQIVPGTNNNVFVTSTGVNSALPACAAPGGRYVLDISTATGKAAYAALLSAKLTNNVVTLIGTNTCTFDPTAENLSQIQF